MKLRVRENSIRFRLQMSEIKRLGEVGFVTERIKFGKERFLIYTIRIDDRAKEITSVFENDEVLVSVPLKQAKEWITTDLVGLETLQPVDRRETLRILLEKDFKCLSPRSGEKDMFPNPKESH